VFDGRAICAALDAHPARKVGHVDGWAASAASFILMHCDEVEITEGAMVMIHNGWTFAAGDNRVMTDTAGLLQKIDGAIQDDYMRRVNVDHDQVVAWMNAETWFTAAEAVEHGFADRIAGGEGAKARATWNVAAYANAPKPEATQAPSVVEEPAPEPNPAAEAEHAHRRRAAALAAL
jgi:ATP-dependent Clp protease protease subunit